MSEPSHSPLDEHQPPQFRRGFNPAFWYGVLGAAVLVATFWVPVATARRTARVEERGDQLAAALLSVASQLGRFYPVDTGAGRGANEQAFVLAHQDRMSVHTGPEPGFTAQLRRFIRKSVSNLAEKILEARAGR